MSPAETASQGWSFARMGARRPRAVSSPERPDVAARCVWAVAFVLGAGWLLGVTGTAEACSCVQTTPETAFSEHDAVFEGRVVSVVDAIAETGGRVVVLEVVQAWKGVERETVEVSTAASDGLCGVPFEVETSWLVYADRAGADRAGADRMGADRANADRAEGRLSTGLCSRTRRIEEAGEDLAFLGAGTVPVEITDEDGVEPPATARGPARGGCASCAVRGGAPPRGGALLAVALFALLLRRQLL